MIRVLVLLGVVAVAGVGTALNEKRVQIMTHEHRDGGKAAQ